MFRAALGTLFLASSTGCATGWNGGELYVKRRRPAWRAQYREATYRVGLPGDDWKPHREKGIQVAWRHAREPSIIQVRSQCDEHGDSDLASFTDHLRIDFTDWKIIEQRSLQLVRREALRTRVSAKLDGAPIQMELVVLKKNGCLFDLSYISVPRSFDAGLADFDRVVEGFRFPLEGRR